jgi:catechol 2,3-dioxygenase-like lactoylglutathione lyase family enzyme
MTVPLQGICPLLQVFDMPASIAFYRDVLGFRVVSDAPPDGDCDWVWLRHGDADLMLNTAYERPERPAAPDPARVASHADTCLFFGCADLDAAFATLRARGLAVEPPVVRPYGMRQLSLRDPDGYGICLQWRAS